MMKKNKTLLFLFISILFVIGCNNENINESKDKPENNKESDLICFISSTNKYDSDTLYTMDMNGSNWTNLKIQSLGDECDASGFKIAKNGRFLIYYNLSIIGQYVFSDGKIHIFYPEDYYEFLTSRFTISPTNKFIAYVVLQDGPKRKSNLRLVNLDDYTSKNLTNSDFLDVLGPLAFNPEGNMLAFVTYSRKIVTINIDGSNRKTVYKENSYNICNFIFNSDNSLIVGLETTDKKKLINLNILDGSSKQFQGFNYNGGVSISFDLKMITGNTKEGDVFYCNVDGTEVKIIHNGKNPVFTSDRKNIIFDRYMGGNTDDIFKFNLATGEEVNLTRSKYRQIFPKIIKCEYE